MFQQVRFAEYINIELFVFIFIHSGGPLQEHIPRVPAVHLPGGTGVPDSSKPHWLCFLRDPEVEE